MTTNKILRGLRSRFPGYIQGKDGLWLGADTPIACGLNVEPSRFNNEDFTFKAVLLPLFCAKTYVSFTYSQDIRPIATLGSWVILPHDLSSCLDLLEHEFHRQGDEFLAHGKSVESFVSWLNANEVISNDPHVQRDMAYCCVYLGDRVRAAELLRKIIDECLPEAGWQHKLALQAQQVCARLQHGAEAAKVLLDEFCEQSRRGLGFPAAPHRGDAES